MSIRYLDSTSALSYIDKIGEDQESGPFLSSQKPLEILSRKQYNPDSGLSVSGLKQSFGLGVIQSEQLQRIEAETRNIPSNSENFVSHAGRPPVFRINFQLNKYIRWRPDPSAWKTDALTIPWEGIQGYAFPPFVLIARVMAKVIREKASTVLVTPLWETQRWYPVLLLWSIANPLLIP